MNNKRVSKLKELIFEKSFWQNAWAFPSIMFAVVSVILSFYDFDFKNTLFWIILGVSIIYIISFLIRASGLKSVTLNIDGSIFEISVGDIFEQDTEDYKVIAFNEYFDSKVDNDLISASTLNGMYIQKKYPKLKDVRKFDARITNDPRLKKNIKETGVLRGLGGKTTKYELGSIYRDEDYFLVALSKFDDDNEAGLNLTEYATCLLKFWSEVNTLYNQKTVVMPLLGTGITRKRDYDATDQQLLEVLIWTFKISKVKFREPSKIKIVIHEDKKRNINFYKLKELEKNGI